MKKESNTITSANLERYLADYTNRVRYYGEQFTITKHGRPVAKLVPVKEPEKTVAAKAVGK